MDNNALYHIWLTKALSLDKLHKVLAVFDTPQKAFDAKDDEIFAAPLESAVKDAISNKDLAAAYKVLEDCDKNGIRPIGLGSEEYPELLAEIIDPPCVLYVKGVLPDLAKSISLAMVGTRHPSVYAVKMAKKFSYEVASGGIIVVSGLARGIDTLCHKGALAANMKTIAVLGCGVDIVYLSENTEIQRLISENGAVISEYPPGVPPLACNFPARNRIISGLSQGVFVVEGTVKSGTMITCRLAQEQGREVFTIPTNLDNVKGSGNIALIKQGAKVVEDVTDVFEEFLMSFPEQALSTMTKKEAVEISDSQRIIMRILEPSIPTNVDEICKKAAQGAAEANGNLTILELKGLVVRLPGKNYILK
jgi:DNA processing protein